MIENQETHTKWVRECPDADRFSIELYGQQHPYQWRVSSMRSEIYGEVILKGRMISGTEVQIREELCHQLKNIVTKLG